MATNPPGKVVMITTSSAGLTWECLVASGVQPEDCALLTTPGAALGQLEYGMRAALTTALGETRAQQILVVGHAADPLYEEGLEAIWNAAGKFGIDTTSAAGTERVPGLEGGPVRTVRRAVRTLVKAGWLLPPGLVVVGMVIGRDGTADNVALEVVGMLTDDEPEPDRRTAEDRKGLRPPPPRREAPKPAVVHEEQLVPGEGRVINLDRQTTPPASPPRPPEPEPPPPPVAEPTPVVPAGPVRLQPDGADYGQVRLDDASVTGPYQVAGEEIAAGPVHLGESAASGPIGLGGEVSTGRSVLGESSLGGPVSEGAISQGGPLSNDSALGGLAEAIPAPPPISSSFLDGGAPDLLQSWINEDANAASRTEPPWQERATAGPMPVPRQVPQSKEEELQIRLTDATTLIKQFLVERCPTHTLTRDMKRIHRAGTRPGAIMKNLLTLVRKYADDWPEVRAAYSTLEMAQSVLSRGELMAVLGQMLD